MAHYLSEIHFPENVCTFFCKGSKSFTSKIEYFNNRSLSKLTTVSEIDIVRYFNIHCKCNFGYKVCYTQSNYDEYNFIQIVIVTAITIKNKFTSFKGGRWNIIVNSATMGNFINIIINRLKCLPVCEGRDTYCWVQLVQLLQPLHRSGPFQCNAHPYRRLSKEVGGNQCPEALKFTYFWFPEKWKPLMRKSNGSFLPKTVVML